MSLTNDGDADRIAVLTHKNKIKGDMMALLYSMKMDKPTVVGEVKCSQVMYDELERRGAKAIMYKTGHSNLKVKMKEVNADLACEVSGHICFKNRYFGYDDAIYGTLRMLELLHDGIDLDEELAKLPEVFSDDVVKYENAVNDLIQEAIKSPKVLSSHLLTHIFWRDCLIPELTIYHILFYDITANNVLRYNSINFFLC